jgi:tetratricopeptide (TPR) repeat protein
LYNGEIKRAIIYLSVFVFSASCAAFFYFLVFIHSIVAILPALLGSSLLLFSHIHCVIDGYKISKLINLHISKIDDLKTNDVGEKIKTSLSLFTSRNYEPALYSLTRIVESNPNDSKVYYNRGVMYYKLGDYANAKKDIITAARLGHEKSKHILEVYNIDY